MPSLVVDPAALRATADRLRELGDELADAGRELTSVAVPGRDDVATAAARFLATWGRALDRTGAVTTEAADHVTRVAAVWAAVDRGAGGCP